MATNASKSTSFSHEKLLAVRAEGFAAIRQLSAKIASIGNAIEDLDRALQTSIAVRGNDDLAATVAAFRNLTAMLESEVV